MIFSILLSLPKGRYSRLFSSFYAKKAARTGRRAARGRTKGAACRNPRVRRRLSQRAQLIELEYPIPYSPAIQIARLLPIHFLQKFKAVLNKILFFHAKRDFTVLPLYSLFPVFFSMIFRLISSAFFFAQWKLTAVTA